jgi:Fur family ferric uptake transcriptional regulator
VLKNVMGSKCCHSSLSEQNIKDLLTDLGLNKTKLKVEILHIISKSKIPISVHEIHSELSDKCDISSVFRSISQFKEKKLISEVNLDEGFLRYELTSLKKNHHHHHILCRQCGEIKNLEECDLDIFEKALSKLGYTQMEHRLEFTGLCSKCSHTFKIATGHQE